MVWGCFTEHGIDSLGAIGSQSKFSRIHKKFNRSLITTNLELFPNAHLVTFMQDNARSHKTKVVSHWFTEMNIKVFEDWTPQSPDFNPIETLWEYVNRDLTNYNIYNIEQLWLAVKNV